MKKLLPLLVLFVSMEAISQTEPFNKRTVITLPANSNPWEVVYGPNDSLWVTESKGYTIDRINIANGAKTQVLDLTTQKTTWASGTGPQGGLMGLALHPNLYSTNPATRAAKPWVYVVYVYNKTTPNSTCNTPGAVGGCPFTTRLVRYDYVSNTLSNPVTILNNIPGSSDHNSGRLAIGPDLKLYYTVGDMGAGQLTNTNRTNNAQNIDVMEGKVLRLNTEVDGDAGADAWVPNDNQFYNAAAITPQDYVYSYGHRNPQGLVWGKVNGVDHLYSSEQSDRADDEVNLIAKGNNYGWDKVSGKCDGDVNGFQIGGQLIGNEMTNCAGTTQPMFTFFHSNATWPSSYPANGSPNAAWPTVAASSVEFYNKQVIPGWPASLLITPLKDDKIYRLKLDAAGNVTGDTVSYFRGDGSRIRRIISDPTGLKFFVARDNQTIMEYTYTGITLPVQLMYFKGSLQNNVSALEWATSSEINSSHFVIQRSTDGITYEDIATVQAHGNNSSTLVYTYQDTRAVNQQAKVLYYKLQMVDIDGKTKNSNTITIDMASKIQQVIVSPNPASGNTKLTLTVAGYGSAKWQIIDNAGAIVLESSLQLSPGINTLNINLSPLSAGLYYLKITGQGINENIKLQKL